MGLLDPTLLRNLKGLTGLLAETPIGKYVRGKDQGLSVDGLKRGLLSIPVFENTPEANQTAYEAAMNIGPMALGKIVYHGSPHKFDRFDASKIGTGEGAQAYGHGVYLADAEDVAKGYQKTLAKDGTGSLYKADLPDEWIPKMLDWDKPLREQAPSVTAPLRKEGFSGKTWQVRTLGENANDSYIFHNAKDARRFAQEERKAGNTARVWNMTDPGYGEAELTGGELLKLLAARESQVDAANKLKQMGIPGIRYLDGGSRGKGQGSYNYVVFPGLEDQVKILERNGIPINDGLLGRK